MENTPLLSRKNLKIALLTFSLLMNITSSAWARSKRAKNRAYSYFDEGGKSTQANCDPERKVPRKLKHDSEFRKAGGYLGSEHVESELQAKDEAKMWKHFFSSQSTCEKYLAQEQKKYELKNGKPSDEKPVQTAEAEEVEAEKEESEEEEEEGNSSPGSE